jgi:hypothetical protein
MHHRFPIFTAAQAFPAIPHLRAGENKAATPRIENLNATMHRRTPDVALSKYSSLL